MYSNVIHIKETGAGVTNDGANIYFFKNLKRAIALIKIKYH